MVDTATRHPYIGQKDLSWKELNSIRDGIVQGKAEEVIALQPFPSRRFMYALETTAAFESNKGNRVDLIPFNEPQSKIAHHIELPYEWQDTKITSKFKSLPKSQANATLIEKNLEPSFFYNNNFSGESENWGFTWEVDDTGSVKQISWLFGLNRSWFSVGQIEKNGNQVCVIFQFIQATCFSSLYQQNDLFLAYAPDGTVIKRFKRVVQ